MVDCPSTNKGWHTEFIKFRWGDLTYFPEYHKPCPYTGGIKRTEYLKKAEMDKVVKFRGGRGKRGLYIDKSFFNVAFLFYHNLK